jgi:hypothetical protein
VATRVEYKVLGDWSAYDQFTSLGDKNPLLVFGAGVDLTQFYTTNILIDTVDAQFNLPGGLNAYAAYMGRWISVGPGHTVAGAQAGSLYATGNNTTGTTKGSYTYDPSVLTQVGYLINDQWEPYLQYTYIYFQNGDGVSSAINGFTVRSRAEHEIVAGTNYYLYGKAVKLTADVGYLPNGCIASDDGGDIQSSAQAELFFRLQLQLLL